MLLLGLAVAGSSYFLFHTIKSELAPVEDQGNIFVGVPRRLRAPPSSTPTPTPSSSRRSALKVPEADRVFSWSRAIPPSRKDASFSALKPWGERERTQQEIAKSIAPEMVAIPGVVAFPSNPPSLGQGARDKPISVVIQTSRPYEELQKMVDAMLEKAEAYPGLVDVDTDLKLNSPQLDIAVDRDKAAAVGVEVETLGRTLETLLGGRQVTRFKRDGEQYDVVVKIADIDRQNPDDLRRIYVRGRDDAMIPLSNLITIKETVAPKELNHFNQLRAATITAQLAPGYSLSDGLDFLEKAAKEVLPAHGPSRLWRPVARVQGSEREHLPHLPARARLHLSRARGAVRELHRSLHHHADRAAVDHRRAARAVVERRHAQHLQPGRPRHPDRADHQARHSDRGVLQSASRQGQARCARP